MLSYVLNKKIDGNQIISDIQNLISWQNIETSESENYILVIQLKKISYTTSDYIPKLTYNIKTQTK